MRVAGWISRGDRCEIEMSRRSKSRRPGKLATEHGRGGSIRTNPGAVSSSVAVMEFHGRGRYMCFNIWLIDK
jgi:hypothetical protein